MEEALIMEVWDTFREYIPDKNKELAAHQYVDFLLGKDIEVAALAALMGYDHLDIAIKAVVDEEKEFEDEEDDGYSEEDEEY